MTRVFQLKQRLYGLSGLRQKTIVGNRGHYDCKFKSFDLGISIVTFGHSCGNGSRGQCFDVHNCQLPGDAFQPYPMQEEDPPPDPPEDEPPEEEDVELCTDDRSMDGAKILAAGSGLTLAAIGVAGVTAGPLGWIALGTLAIGTTVLTYCEVTENE